MKIALVSPLEESVPPKKYGGTEQIVYHLAEKLVEFGHEVYLLASGDSQTKARLIPIFPKALRQEKICQEMNFRNALKFIGVGKIVSILQNLDVDIIHNHLGWRLLPFASLLKKPIVTTLHGPLDIPYQKFIYKQFKDNFYVSISNDQRKPCPDLNFVGTVYNGLELEKFTYQEKPKDYLLFLGRISPEKGIVQAIKIAKKAKKKLIIAAKLDVVDRSFYQKEVKPLIDGKEIVYVGEVGEKRKISLLRNALALLFPIMWREPFGLVMIEAQACGTPVIANGLGSTREVIKDKVTGFILNPKKDILKQGVEAISKISQINRKLCRERVALNFTRELMTQNYLKIYQKILQNYA